MPAPTPFPLRQVHLDFHTSPLIGDVGSEFQAEAFAETMRAAHVQSVSIFARCHHGMAYYPSALATPHPALRGRDLLGEMIVALHRVGIRCPIYTTVGWDEELARLHPEWRMLMADGTFARAGATPGAWWFLEWLHPGYLDFLEAHTRELVARYGPEVDGLFYDILFYPKGGHCSPAARQWRAAHGYAADDDATFRRFESHARQWFGQRFSRLLAEIAPQATVFYNGRLDTAIDGSGGRAYAATCSHLEIESLPSGFWGYFHFPRLARASSHWGQAWIGMTGRFQKMWGDFGGIKPQPALEFECFRAQALGGGNSVGDQLPPRGTLDPGAYALIGAVFAQCAAAEPFYAGSSAVPEVGVLTAQHPDLDPVTGGKSDEGAVQMLEELHYDAAMLDETDDLARFRTLVLPDSVVVSDTLRDKLRAYVAGGGQLLLSGASGLSASDRWQLDFLPFAVGEDEPLFPTYWRARPGFWPGVAAGDRVCYSQGRQLLGGPGTEVLVERVLPYFRRTDASFSSHFQTPPVAVADRHPAVLAGPGAVAFADPIFREYRQTGNMAAREAFRVALRRLHGAPLAGDGLPTTILVVPRRRGADLLLTLLHYIPVRKALDIDVIEERHGFVGEVLRLRGAPTVARVAGSGEPLPLAPGGEGFVLPAAKGRLLLEVPSYYGG